MLILQGFKILLVNNLTEVIFFLLDHKALYKETYPLSQFYGRGSWSTETLNVLCEVTDQDRRFWTVNLTEVSQYAFSGRRPPWKRQGRSWQCWVWVACHERGPYIFSVRLLSRALCSASKSARPPRQWIIFLLKMKMRLTWPGESAGCTGHHSHIIVLYWAVDNWWSWEIGTCFFGVF